MLTAHTIGSKYREVEDLKVKEIAKLIRQDLKKFKGCKFSVKSTYNSVNVKLTDCDDVKKYFYIWEGVNQKDPRYIDILKYLNLYSYWKDDPSIKKLQK